MKKNFKSLILILCLSLFLIGCNNSQGNTAKTYSFSELVNMCEEKDEETVQPILIDHFISEINGHYYCPKTVSKYKDTVPDVRTIYAVSKDEVYFVPYSELELTEMGYSLADIPSMKDSEKYKYFITEADGYGSSVLGNGDTIEAALCYHLTSVYLEGKETDGNFNILLYLRNDNNLDIIGFFVDQTTKEGIYTFEVANNTKMREYYSSVEKAKEAEEEDYQKLIAKIEADRATSNAEPNIGMTKEEVLRGKWGLPDKKNTYTYSWGTHEQWVYEGYGYVYFENGVVTSIQDM